MLVEPCPVGFFHSAIHQVLWRKEMEDPWALEKCEELLQEINGEKDASLSKSLCEQQLTVFLRLCFMPSTKLNPICNIYNLCNNPMSWVLSFIPFYGCIHWGLDRLKDLPKVTELMTGRGGIWLPGFTCDRKHDVKLLRDIHLIQSWLQGHSSTAVTQCHPERCPALSHIILNSHHLESADNYMCDLGFCVYVCVWVAQLCLTLCNPMDCSPPCSCVHGILHARILKWVAISLSRGSSQPRGQNRVSCIAGRFFTIWATREARGVLYVSSNRTMGHLWSCLLLRLHLSVSLGQVLCCLALYSVIPQTCLASPSPPLPSDYSHPTTWLPDPTPPSNPCCPFSWQKLRGVHGNVRR